MKVSVGSFLAALLLMATLMPGEGARADDAVAVDEYPLVSAYLYKFTQFITWPAGAMKNSFNVCVLGKSPFGSALTPLENRTADNRTIEVKIIQHPGDELTSCNLLYIADSESGDLSAAITAASKAPVLTVSNIDGFSDKGGMVELKLRDGKLGILIDLSAVSSAGISISTKLLGLSQVKG